MGCGIMMMSNSLKGDHAEHDTEQLAHDGLRNDDERLTEGRDIDEYGGEQATHNELWNNDADQLTERRDHAKHDAEQTAYDGLRDDDEDGAELAHHALHHHQARGPLHHATGAHLLKIPWM